MPVPTGTGAEYIASESLPPQRRGTIAAQMLLLLLACGPATPCPELHKVARAANLVEKEHRVNLAAAGLLETCKTLPSAQQAALQKLQQMPPELRESAALSAVAADPAAWETACPGGTERMSGWMSQGKAGRGAAIAAACKPDFIGESEQFKAEDTVILAILLRPALQNADSTDRSVVLRALSGL